MPWHVAKSGDCSESKPWAVIKDSDGAIEGCHESKAAAQKQLKALYANEKSRAAPPRGDLVRGRYPGYELRAADDGGALHFGVRVDFRVSLRDDGLPDERDPPGGLLRHAQ